MKIKQSYENNSLHAPRSLDTLPKNSCKPSINLREASL